MKLIPFSPDTKNGRAVRTFVQGLLGVMTSFIILYNSAEFTNFIAGLDALTSSAVFSTVSAVIAATISRLMPVVGALIKLIKDKYEEY